MAKKVKPQVGRGTVRRSAVSGLASGTARSRISSKHQVTIPRQAFADADLREGDVVRVEADGRGRVVLTRTSDVLDDLAGAVPPGTFKPGWLDEVRGESEWPYSTVR